MDPYQLLLDKLDAFIRKFYLNQLLKGALLGIGLLLALFLSLTVLEHYLWLGKTTRQIVFAGFALSFLVIAGKYWFVPIFRLMGLGKRISHAAAAKIIGRHFSHIEDRLLNILQLKDQSQSATGMQRGLIESAITQRTHSLSPVSFTEAISWKAAWRNIRYAIPPLLILAVVWYVNPRIIGDSTQRLVHFNEEFSPPAPFRFVIKNELPMQVAEGRSFTVQVDIRGEYIPQLIYIDLDGESFLMRTEPGTGLRTYHFPVMRQDLEFQIKADGYSSPSFLVDVLPRPVVESLELHLDFPDYLNKTDVSNASGDAIVPEGTRLSWNIVSRKTDKLYMHWADSAEKIVEAPNGFTTERGIRSSGSYRLVAENSESGIRDTSRFTIQVIPDAYPQIEVESKKDSLFPNILYFSGLVRDDYGLTRLKFFYRHPGSDEWRGEKITVERAIRSPFYHVLDVKELNVAPGEAVSYYFEVWDNDGVNGAKSSKTAVFQTFAPDANEVREKLEESAKAVENKLESARNKSEELKSRFEKLRNQMLQKDKMDWQDKKELEKLLKEHRDLEKNLEDLQKQNELKSLQESELGDKNEELLEKQQQLNELFEELMTEEMKELYRELEELMQEQNTNELLEKMQEMQFSEEELEKELDRSLELFKRMEVEKNVREIAEEMEELGKEQQQLSEEEDFSDAEMKEKQQQLDEKFKQLEKRYEEQMEKNNALENSMEMDDFKEEREEIGQDMKEAGEQLEKSNQGKAGKKQKSAGQKMQEMAQQMQQMMQSAEMQQNAEDLEALRMLLENLLTLSFEQEALLEMLKDMQTDNPQYVSVNQQQRKLTDDAVIVKDSLMALSKRVVQIQSVVNREIAAVERHMGFAMNHLSERESSQATVDQQFVMTSLNNLALLLDEALQALQKQMANSKPGMANCNKPGGGGSSPKLSDLKKLQESLSKQLEEMKKGKKPGGKKPGGKEGMMPGMSKELAKMAAKQAAIRKKLNQLAEELNQDGKGTGNPLRQIADEMEKQEEDIVNKRINLETIKRQQEILTRLLEAENADLEREMDKKRKSKTADQQLRRDPEQFFEYEKRKLREIEMLKTFPAELNSYYKGKVNQYMNQN